MDGDIIPVPVERRKTIGHGFPQIDTDRTTSVAPHGRPLAAPLPESYGKTRSAAPARNVFGLLRRVFPQDSGKGAAARSAGP